MAGGEDLKPDSTKPAGKVTLHAKNARSVLACRALFCIALIVMLFALGDMRQKHDFHGMVSAWQLSRAAAARDFYQVWWPAREMSFAGSADLYAPKVRQLMARRAIAQAQSSDAGIHEVSVAKYSYQTYPDYFAATFTPVMVSSYALFALDDYDTSRFIFALVSMGAFAGGLLLLCRLAGVSWTASFAMVAVVVWTCQPLRNDIVDGNVNRLQIGAMGLYLWLTLRRSGMAWQTVAGVLVGGLVLFKPNLVLLPIFVSAALMASSPRSRWLQQWGGMVIAGLLGVIVPAFMFGAPLMWLRWLGRMSQIHATPYAVSEGNIATARLILETTGLNLSLPLAIVLIAIGVALCAFLARRGKGLTPQIALLTAGAAGMVAMVASQLAWPHYALLLLPLLLAGWSTGGRPLTLPHLVLRAVIIACYVVIAERHLRQIFELSNITYGWLLTLAMLVAAAAAVYAMAASSGPAKHDAKHDANDDTATPATP